MKYLSITILFSIFFTVKSSATDNTEGSVNFYNASIEEAMELASAEGKLTFVDFHAQWCGPCKWMDQTTFSNKSVSKYLNENFVAIKIDIDEFDGYTAKEYYNIETLPTMLIFNSKGQLVDRIEETLSPSKLMKILKTHNHKGNKTIVRHNLNSSPRKKLTSYKNRPSRSSRAYQPQTTYSTRKKSKFRVNVGTFQNSSGAHNYYNVLQQTFADPIVILQEVEKGKVVYNVLMGDFITESEANDYKKILEEQFDIKGKIH